MDVPAVSRLLRRQSGVIGRRQVLEVGGPESFVARKVRRREWVRVHNGVYVDHTGPLSVPQREWAALLLHPGSVLADRSSLRVDGITYQPRGGSAPVELAVPHGRNLGRVSGRSGRISVFQLRGFEQAARPAASPPRLRVEHAALRVASSARSDDEAAAVLADAVRQGATTHERLASTLETSGRLRRRALLGEVLADVAVGVESPLERRYLREVERAHGLPRGERQVREVVELLEGEELRFVRRDVRYRAEGALVELDGRIGHTAAPDRWADLTRDLEAAAKGDVTLRAGWRQVLDPCRLASIVGRVLQSRGWADAPTPCRDVACLVRPECAA